MEDRKNEIKERKTERTAVFENSPEAASQKEGTAERAGDPAAGKSVSETGKSVPETGTAAPAKESAPPKRKSRRLLPRILLVICVVCAACAGGYWYYWNLPEQRLGRTMEEADALLQEASYEEAAEQYRAASAIDEEFFGAKKGLLLALTGKGDQLASREDISVRAQALDVYEEILQTCEDMTSEGDDEDGSIRKMGDETGEKIRSLQAEIAASYTSIETKVEADDRSGEAVQPDGTKKPYTWYYDLVRIDDEYYPYADRIHAVFEQDRDSFFSRTDGGPAKAAAGGKKDGDYRDYVGVAGTYSGEGLLSIRMAEVRSLGSARANYYCGHTFRLSDASEVTLRDLTGKTGRGLQRLVRHSIRDWIAREGYQGISKSAIEDYSEETDPEDFKFCINQDGTLCLIIDQDVPFFTTGTEILEIPLQE